MIRVDKTCHQYLCPVLVELSIPDAPVEIHGHQPTADKNSKHGNEGGIAQKFKSPVP